VRTTSSGMARPTLSKNAGTQEEAARNPTRSPPRPFLRHQSTSAVVCCR